MPNIELLLLCLLIIPPTTLMTHISLSRVTCGCTRQCVLRFTEQTPTAYFTSGWCQHKPIFSRQITVTAEHFLQCWRRQLSILAQCFEQHTSTLVVVHLCVVVTETREHRRRARRDIPIWQLLLCQRMGPSGSFDHRGLQINIFGIRVLCFSILSFTSAFANWCILCGTSLLDNDPANSSTSTTPSLRFLQGAASNPVRRLASAKAAFGDGAGGSGGRSVVRSLLMTTL
jgi:hypothetical protein